MTNICIFGGFGTKTYYSTKLKKTILLSYSTKLKKPIFQIYSTKLKKSLYSWYPTLPFCTNTDLNFAVIRS